MNILVVNGYVRQNKGDAALMSVLCHELQKSFPQATIKISSQENPCQDPKFEGWQNVGSLNRYCFDPTTGKLNHLLRLLFSGSIITFLPYIPRKFCRVALRPLPYALRVQLLALIKADLVVSMGGGYLNGDRSLMANACVYLMLAPLALAKRFGACAVCAPQSMGPFATNFQRKMVTRTLEKVDLILTREKKTIKLLAELPGHFPVVSSVDSGFLFNVDVAANLRSKLQVSSQKLLVGVTVRRWLDPSRQQKYEQAIAQTVDYLTSHYQAAVVFIPQVTSSLGGDDDRMTAEKVYAKIKHKSHVYLLGEHYTHQQIKSLYNALDLIIGTRFHSVIFSLTSLVPALAIEYEHKTSGIMRDLGLEQWVIRIEDVTAGRLTAALHKLLRERAHYKSYLSSRLPSYLRQARDTIGMLAASYSSSRD